MVYGVAEVASTKDSPATLYETTLKSYVEPLVRPETIVDKPVVVALGEAEYEEAEASLTYTLYPLTGAAVVEVAADQERLMAASPEVVPALEGAAGVVMAVTGPVMLEAVS